MRIVLFRTTHHIKVIFTQLNRKVFEMVITFCLPTDYAYDWSALAQLMPQRRFGDRALAAV